MDLSNLPTWHPPARRRRHAAAALCAVGLAWSLGAGALAAGLTVDETLALARQSAPMLRAQQAQLAGSTAAQPAAATRPDPRLTVGIDNLPLAGPDRYSTTRDGMTMQRLSLMQDMPNRAKLDARQAMARSRIERDRASLRVAELAVQREALLAWLAVYYAERKREVLGDFEGENRLLQQTLAARIAADRAMPADLTMARQEALTLADRSDDARRDVQRARAELRRWVGERADEPLAGLPPVLPVHGHALREGLARHAEVALFTPMREMAAAEAAEVQAETRGDWSWELIYSRRPKYDDMVSLMLTFELPWQRERRQQPLALAKLREVERIEAEREDLLRKHAAELEAMLAELQALDAQIARLEGSAKALAAERVALTLASYQAGKADLNAVLMARKDVIETRMKAVELESMRAAVRARLATLMAAE